MFGCQTLPDCCHCQYTSVDGPGVLSDCMRFRSTKLEADTFQNPCIHNLPPRSSLFRDCLRYAALTSESCRLRPELFDGRAIYRTGNIWGVLTPASGNIRFRHLHAWQGQSFPSYSRPEEQFSLLRCRSLVLTLTCLVAALQFLGINQRIPTRLK